ncbi:uncharacterized protein F5147DRAFT_806552 [Suillus discolor]|uniref:Uncharacterized protein n=1 Tax=Suillus discolor TaxID=1912936 RepID=A0A9P7JZV3_9AGAM|nr:uncharacterized protein F5147DRAFT_806552 [Suillus discolor]KAG2117891.1 hypothetical protein F5147DRAFT_806552 [Suillus discolor]
MSAHRHAGTSLSSSVLPETSDSYVRSTSETSFKSSPEPVKLGKCKHKSDSPSSKLSKRKHKPSDEEEEKEEKGAMTPHDQCLNFARWIPRGINMFCILKDVFRIAPLIEDAHAQSDDDSDVDDMYNTLLSNISKDTQDQILRTYKKTIAGAPYLQEFMKGDQKKSAELQEILDDMQYLIGQVTKAKLEAGTINMDARAWPALLYKAGATGVAGEAFDLTNVQDGLFEGFLVERVMKHVLTSPSSALAGDNFHISNSCNAVIHRMMIVEAENIAYAAACSAITSCDKWTTEDSKFSYRKFYYRIIDIIRNLPDKAWATATLQHYNLKLFKDKAGRAAALLTSATSDAGDLDEDEDNVALMRKQFALRSAKLASTVKPAAPPPAPSSIDSEVLPPRLHTHKDPGPSASSSSTLHSSSPSPLVSKPHQPVASQVQAPCSPAAAPSTSKLHPIHTAPSEASTPLPCKKQKLTQPESPLTESEAEEVETPVQKSPQKAQPKASGKTTKSTSAPKKRRMICNDCPLSHHQH